MKRISLVLGVVIMSLGAVYMAMAWTSPPSDPPSGNIDSPLNTSITAQSKEGALVVGANSAVTTGLIVQYGNVGIGTTNPGAKLEVAGTGKITGTLDMSSQRITSVAAPTAEADAATKAYVDASSGGGGTLITWGSAAGVSNGYFFVAPAAGTSAPACPSGWTQLYVGYGPFNFYIGGSTAVTSSSSDICSTSLTAYGPATPSPCSTSYSQYGTNYSGCNTCRVCVEN
jgi:hypothetical protein